ncbi:hypothetical protein GGS26DRAFT_550649 [Hypomontagnella submonticulosa]|nr:hypothetical protein GGS26DRAFT_550649 [Hypomontagnella submonticulosa]
MTTTNTDWQDIRIDRTRHESHCQRVPPRGLLKVSSRTEVQLFRLSVPLNTQSFASLIHRRSLSPSNPTPDAMAHEEQGLLAQLPSELLLMILQLVIGDPYPALVAPRHEIEAGWWDEYEQSHTIRVWKILGATCRRFRQLRPACFFYRHPITMSCIAARELSKGVSLPASWNRDKTIPSSINSLLLTKFSISSPYTFQMLPRALRPFAGLRTCTLVVGGPRHDGDVREIEFPAKMKTLFLRMGVPQDLELRMGYVHDIYVNHGRDTLETVLERYVYPMMEVLANLTEQVQSGNAP